MIKAKLSDNASKDPRPVTFDELAKTWNDLLSLENPDIPDNNTIIYGLMILNSTGMDTPIHRARRDKIISQFCILFKDQSVSRRNPNLIDECTPTIKPQNVAEYKLAKQVSNMPCYPSIRFLGDLNECMIFPFSILVNSQPFLVLL